MEELAKSGVRVRVLTNSLDATDVMPVHAAYMRYRYDLLNSGVELLELRALRREHRDRSLPEIWLDRRQGCMQKPLAQTVSGSSLAHITSIQGLRISTLKWAS